MTDTQPNEDIVDSITAKIDATGRLIYADPALRRLHIKAGGSDGGMIAIPAIANIAHLTHKLKTPLSRMVHVADQDFDLTLWIDSKLHDDIAILSILGWTENSIVHVHEPEGVSIGVNDLGEDILFLSNQNNIIISFQTGERNVADFGQFVGHNIFDIISADTPVIDTIKSKFDNHVAIDGDIITIDIMDMAFEFSAIPRFDDIDNFLGHECYISPVTNEFRSPYDDATPQNSQTIYQGLMASQLAPAIRQPLGRIIANADTIGSKLHGPIRENYANYAKDIANAARHLIEIVDDLGDLEAIEKPGFEIAQDDLELGDIAQRLSGLLALKANEKSILIEVDTTQAPVHAVGEFRRVLQIGLNILTNAVRYSPNDSKITIQVGNSGKNAYISFKDQGPGIDPLMHCKIFDKFERLGLTGDGGSGLGLYISRRLAHAMKGDLIIESALSEGACFTLLLPKK